jgi:uncharacterized membrane protein
MAEGWTLGVGILALVIALAMTALSLLRPRGPARPGLDPAGLGAALVVMGIVFGDEPLGYALVAAGVVVSVGAAIVARRPAGS